MLFNALLSLSLISLATAYPSPSADTALATLFARGIDPSGPIPADAVPISGGGFSFSADSDTAHWVRAQSSFSSSSSSSDLTKRESSGLAITLWTLFGCSGSGAYFANVQYGQPGVGSILYYQSAEIRGRSLRGNEQLDFSYVDVLGGNKCAHYVGSATKFHPVGCSDQGAFSCFRLLKF